MTHHINLTGGDLSASTKHQEANIGFFSTISVYNNYSEKNEHAGSENKSHSSLKLFMTTGGAVARAASHSGVTLAQCFAESPRLICFCAEL